MIYVNAPHERNAMIQKNIFTPKEMIAIKKINE